MSRADLESLRDRVDRVIERKQEDERIEAVNNAVLTARRAGLSYDDLILALLKQRFHSSHAAYGWLQKTSTRWKRNGHQKLA